MEGALSEDATFDLSPLVASVRRSRRGVVLFFSAFGLLFLLTVAVSIVPSFFEQPHPTEICSKGTCIPVPQADYYWNVAFYTAIFGVLGGSFLAGGILLSRAPAPSSIIVSNHGFTVLLENGRRIHTSWNSSDLLCALFDQTATQRAHPRAMKRRPSLFGVRSGKKSGGRPSYFFLTRLAFDAVMGSARARGQLGPATAKVLRRFTEDVVFQVLPLTDK